MLIDEIIISNKDALKVLSRLDDEVDICLKSLMVCGDDGECDYNGLNLSILNLIIVK
jgi:hypothetical protein